ncbi:hypothetical protein [Methyloferula stellata]|uniref:hypothetical protein n=1 Tax=Methyloferula stellata TaxID=876270 RepID=UPI000367ED42|nr:hypothetical protein [Methyloferula stellata]
MTAIKGYFSALAAIVASLTRSAAGIFALVIILLVIVLNVAALMRLFEWHWWLALPAAILLIFIPILGWLAAIVFAVFGGIYLAGSGFDWQDATHAAKPAGSFATMTIMEFDAYRRNVMPEGLAKACKEDVGRSLGTGTQLPVRASNYCECYGQASADTLTQADLAYREKTGHYADEATARVKDAVLSRCGT